MKALPDEDRRLSPYTGFGRAHWEAAADATLAAARKYASPRHALIDLPGPVSVSGRLSDGLEGFARTFLAAGFRLAQGDDAGGLAQWYARGLAAGVDPDSPERWPDLNEVHQARVEAASIALALHESRAVLWDLLDDRVRQQVVEWLSRSVGQHYVACNWVWFQNVVEAFLRSVGGPWSSEDIERNIALTESWHVADGWYTDGFAGAAARNFDWYAGWAMNFYPLWYCRMSGAHASPELWSRYRQRLHSYLQGAQHLFAPNGSPLHQGRSLTYRFAAAAPVWAGAVFDASPLPPGRTRRLASGTLRYFVEAGSWDSDDIQRIGWHGEFEPIRQPYSGPGSPYWSSKGFAGLVLPAGHPVWTEPEQPLVVEESDVALTLRAPGWLVSGTQIDGVIRVVNHGTDHHGDEGFGADDPGYARHAYSTHAGPAYGTSSWHAPVDNHIALIDVTGAVSHRRPLTPGHLSDHIGASRYRAHWLAGSLPDAFVWPPQEATFHPGPAVSTASVLRGAVEIRLARIEEFTSCHLRFGGYQIADREAPEVIVDGATATVRCADGLTSVLIGLWGLPDAAVIEQQGTDAFGPHSAVPVVTSGGPAIAGEIYAAAVVLTGSLGVLPWRPGGVDLDGWLPEIEVAAGEIRVRWPEGTVDVVRL